MSIEGTIYFSLVIVCNSTTGTDNGQFVKTFVFLSPICDNQNVRKYDNAVLSPYLRNERWKKALRRMDRGIQESTTEYLESNKETLGILNPLDLVFLN